MSQGSASLRDLGRVVLMNDDRYPTAADISYIARVAGVTAYFPTDSDYPRRWFYPRYSDGRLHEPASTRYLLDNLTSESTFIDVGAHLGYFSVLAALKCRQVFAIEPMEFLVPLIHRNTVANHLSNVHIIYAAAGREAGFVTMDKIGGPGRTVGGEGKSLVPVVRIDDYFSDMITAKDVIKIDVEGYEMNALAGARETLSARPKLMVEIHHKVEMFGHRREQVYDFLSDLGYTMRIAAHRGDGDVPLSRAEAVSSDNAMVFCS